MKQERTQSNHKNLTYQDRLNIEERLNNSYTFTQIAEELCRNPKTISREIKRGYFTREKNHDLRKGSCAHLSECKITNLCNNTYCRKDVVCCKCKIRTCSQYCDSYTPGSCSRLLKPPFVCNPCKRYTPCGFDKRWYRASYADDAYHHRMINSRMGVDITPEEIYELDQLITPLLVKGQSISHIYATNGDSIKCSRRSLYSYIDMGLFKARNIDLPRKVRYKPRKKKKDIKANQVYRVNRTYNEFEKYIGINLDFDVVEMDVVKGTKEGKVLLTLLFRQSNLMLIFLMDRASQECVSKVFDELTNRIGLEGMRKLFPVIFSDYGGEFKDPWTLEKDSYGDDRTKIFYCDPYKSYQKGKIEKNHEFIRYILPKGKSFNRLNQDDVTLMTNHINSIA